MKKIICVVIFLSLYYCLVVCEVGRPVLFPKPNKPKSNISCSQDRHLEDTLKCECKLGVSLFFSFRFKIRVIISDLLLKVNFDWFFLLLSFLFHLKGSWGPVLFPHANYLWGAHSQSTTIHSTWPINLRDFQFYWIWSGTTVHPQSIYCTDTTIRIQSLPSHLQDYITWLNLFPCFNLNKPTAFPLDYQFPL
jgi:hypothetical protein